MAKLYSHVIKSDALTAYEGLKFIAKRSGVKFIFALNFCYLKPLALKLRFASGFAWDKFGFKGTVLG